MRFGDFVPYRILSQGIQFRGDRVPLLGPSGIFKPRVLPEIPLTFMTAPEKPGKPAPFMMTGRPTKESSSIDTAGRIPYIPITSASRKAMINGIPLIYLFGVNEGFYKPIWPCFVIEDHPENLAFSVMVDETQAAMDHDRWILNPDLDLRRRYITVEVQRRLHQVTFRARVLHAYRNSCAICQLRHPGAARSRPYS